ncbi:MAG: helix-turn-helix domain-containing protein [Bacteroidota bacterium]
MRFGFNDYSSFLLFFFLYGLIFSFLLARTTYLDQLKSSGWLSLFLILCSLYVSPFMCGYAGWYGLDYYREFLYFMPLQQLFLIGPIFYFYTRSLIQADFSFSFREMLHLVPAILYGLYSLIVFVGDVFLFEEYHFYADGRDKDLDFWYQMSGLISMLFYLGLSLKAYNQYRKRVLDTLSFADAVLFQWVPRYLISFGIILILRVLFFILNPEWGEFGRKFWYYAWFSILYFYIGISGYTYAIRQGVTNSMHQTFQEFDWKPTPIMEVVEEAPTQSTVLDQAFLADWTNKINTKLESDRLYADPKLTLNVLARTLDTNPKVISQVINQGFEMNFNDFINQHRVEALIEKLKAGTHHQQTLLSIAFDCGFNSKSTFNRAFKKYKGITPMQFIKNDLEIGAIS